MIVNLKGMLLSEEVFLFCHEPDGRPRCKPDFLKTVISGAMFTDLVLMGQASIRHTDRPPSQWVLDVRPVSLMADPVLDRLLPEVQRYANKEPYFAIHLMSDVVWAAVTQRLLERGVLSSVQPVVTVPEYHRPGEVTVHMNGARAALESALVNGIPPSARIGALIAVLRVAKLLEPVMAPPDRATKKTIRKNLKALAPAKDDVANMAVSITAANVSAKMGIGVEALENRRE